jgi:hypothetical protein
VKVPAPPFAPDRATIDTDVTDSVVNLLPGPDHYKPCPSLQLEGSIVALAGPPLGNFTAEDSSGTYTTFVAATDGAVERLYQYNGDGTYTDRSKSGGYAASDVRTGWTFLQYGNWVWAMSGANNAVQRINLTDLVTGFTDVVGNNDPDGFPENPPRCQFGVVISEFVVLAGLTDFPNAVQWSGFGDQLEWNLGTNGSDRQEFPDGGVVQGLIGSEYGVIFQENSIRRMQFIPGDPLVFAFARISERIGTTAPNTIRSANGRTYALLEDGVYLEQGGQLSPIGKYRIDMTLLADTDQSNLYQVIGYIDPSTQRYWLFYPSTAQSDPKIKNRAFVYDPFVDKWSFVETDVTGIGTVASPAASLDALTGSIDAATVSWDSLTYFGGRPVFAGFDSSYKLGTWTGLPLEATLETNSMQIGQMNRGLMKRMMAMVDTASLTLAVGVSDRPDQTISWRTGIAPSSRSGWAYRKVVGKYFRFRIVISAGANWTKLQGFDIDGGPEGTW